MWQNESGGENQEPRIPLSSEPRSVRVGPTRLQLEPVLAKAAVAQR